MQRFDFNTKWGKDKYLLLDNSELTEYADKHRRVLNSEISPSWHGTTATEFFQKICTGDQKLVSESDAFLNKIEDQIPVSTGWKNYDDVVGAIPNVPAFLAGHPQCMRRRQRTWKESAPISIFMDTTSSGGINADRVQKRGVVLLALARLLVEHRPVELWVGAALNANGGGSGTIAWRIETAPLDLARAAFHIGATAMSRGFGYKVVQSELKCGGSWPFSSYKLHCETAKERLASVFQGQEILYIPPILLGDPLTDDPVGWIKRTLAQYIGEDA